ncbi:TPA: transcriptional regulator [Legionella pneumophila]|nr:transcriptional regulator [Legionella pneumophila]HAU0349950.1 transcriptional regulator [Legionella pneumophila]HAU0353441.1 transcriptional regulator [Legionella pneumophila]HAU0359530.1 transcriptional regulator [Legionella pneumophila]HAU0368087.1 transcriptional regulator [Legionella pneumophila]
MSALAIDYTDVKTHHRFHLPISVFKKPINDVEYQELETLLDKLIDEVRDNEEHPLALVMQIIGENLESYDNEHHVPIGHHVSDIEMVKYLMAVNKLLQKDLIPIFGSQANVSKFLSGERKLGKNQILGLKKKFHVSADFFMR